MKQKFIKWAKAAGMESIKVASSTALSLLTVGTVMSDIDWVAVGSASLLSGIISLLISIKGLPKLKGGE